MKSRIVRGMLLMGALSAALLAHAQSSQQFHITSADVSVTYTGSLVKPTYSSSNVWLQGGGIDGGFAFYRGLGLAASVIGEHNSNIEPGIGITKLSVMGGPRYTYKIKHESRIATTRIFGESLMGFAHAYDSKFPPSGGSTTHANAFTMEAGGGVDLELGRQFGLRLPEIHYVRTDLVNGGNNTQNDLRLGIGVSYHFRKP